MSDFSRYFYHFPITANSLFLSLIKSSQEIATFSSFFLLFYCINFIPQIHIP